VFHIARLARKWLDRLSLISRCGLGPAAAGNRQEQLPLSTMIQVGFLKSRVYAKLLRRLILKCYQTFNRQRSGLERSAHDTAACEIGNKVNR
jgi:hypothetical protein